MDSDAALSWWLPIIEERIRNDTIGQARTISENSDGNWSWNPSAWENLQAVIAGGEIDGALLQEMRHHIESSRDPAINQGKKEIATGTAENSPPSTHDVNGNQSSPDAPNSSLSKKEKKARRKKSKRERMRAKLSEEPTDQTHATVTDHPIIATDDSSTASLESDSAPINISMTRANVLADELGNRSSDLPTLEDRGSHLEDTTVSKPEILVKSAGSGPVSFVRDSGNIGAHFTTPANPEVLDTSAELDSVPDDLGNRKHNLPTETDPERDSEDSTVSKPETSPRSADSNSFLLDNGLGGAHSTALDRISEDNRDRIPGMPALSDPESGLGDTPFLTPQSSPKSPYANSSIQDTDRIGINYTTLDSSPEGLSSRRAHITVQAEPETSLKDTTVLRPEVLPRLAYSESSFRNTGKTRARYPTIASPTNLPKYVSREGSGNLSSSIHPENYTDGDIVVRDFAYTALRASVESPHSDSSHIGNVGTTYTIDESPETLQKHMSWEGIWDLPSSVNQESITENDITDEVTAPKKRDSVPEVSVSNPEALPQSAVSDTWLSSIENFGARSTPRRFQDELEEDINCGDLGSSIDLESAKKSIIPNQVAASAERDSISKYSTIDDSCEGSSYDSSETCTEDQSEELSEDINEEDGDNDDISSEPADGTIGLSWAYATHTPADNDLLSLGIWLFEKPAGYYQAQPQIWRRGGHGGVEQAPVVLKPREGMATIPTAEFDSEVLFINTHQWPWPDVRYGMDHPDTLPPTRLLEYQAVESMGFRVWRHDRDFIECRASDCPVKVADHDSARVICFGCGPKTVVRYCCAAHQRADLHEHWSECGHPNLVIKRVIDHNSEPIWFRRYCPAIRDCRNIKNYALYRQGFHTRITMGHYTVFDPENEDPIPMTWPRNDPRSWEEMERRVERVLNCALLDQRNKSMIAFLFRLLRQSLQIKKAWVIGTMYVLKTQFAAEFKLDASRVEEEQVCECEWVGAEWPEDRHLQGCKRLYRSFGSEFRECGMRGYLKVFEARYWILRAWQQKHPTVNNWRDRVAGIGFEGAVEGTNPALGPGWLGWGAADDDVCS